MLGNLKREIDQIAKDKGIDSKEITGALEEAMRQAARRRFGQDKEIEARYNDEIGEVELFEFREVVEAITDPETQILIGEARRDYDPEVEAGDEIGVKLDTSDFGRILAQAAKQVIIQRMRDAERDNIFDEYRDRQGEVVNGIVRRFEKGAIIVDLGPRRGDPSGQGAGAARELPAGRPDPRLRARGQQDREGAADRPVARLDQLPDQALRAGSARDVREDRLDRIRRARAGRTFEDRGRVARQRRRSGRAPASA